MKSIFTTGAAVAALAASSAINVARASEDIRFDLTPSGGVRQCLPNARGEVSIDAGESAELMSVKVEGLPANTAFDVFVIQVPNLPFGLSWYQGDLTTNAKGKGKARFVGRFNIETFIVAPNVAPAPVVHETPIPDADANPHRPGPHLSSGPLVQLARRRPRRRLRRHRDAFQRRAQRRHPGPQHRLLPGRSRPLGPVAALSER
ncbi:MAG: hypothetical protein IPI57_18185 [Candidatus Competibacteraceae bacterium]|nr:hypothetical protein [Candidatus Competibacteraceae bacterium]